MEIIEKDGMIVRLSGAGHGISRRYFPVMGKSFMTYRH